MGGNLFPGNPNASGQAGFGTGAVSSRQVKRLIHRDAHLAPGEKAMQLSFFLAPEARIHHAVGRALAGLLLFGIIPDQPRFWLCQSGVVQKIFDVKGFFLPGLNMLGGEGMPPPYVVLAVPRRETMKAIQKASLSACSSSTI